MVKNRRYKYNILEKDCSQEIAEALINGREKALGDLWDRYQQKDDRTGKLYNTICIIPTI